MARIRFLCSCGRTVWAPEALAGKKAKCPKCGRVLVVPLVAPPPPSLDGQTAGQHAETDGMQVMRLTAPEPLVDLWSSWNGKYAISAHKRGGVTRLDALGGKKLYIAFIDTDDDSPFVISGPGAGKAPKIVEDAVAFQKAAGIEMPLFVSNISDVYLRELQDSPDHIGFMSRKLADEYKRRGIWTEGNLLRIFIEPMKEAERKPSPGAIPPPLAQPPEVPQESDAPKYPYAHYIIEKGTLNVVVERERLESSLNSTETRLLLDLSEDNVQELLRNGRTTVTNMLGGKKEAVTMKGCNCHDMYSHQRGGSIQFRM